MYVGPKSALAQNDDVQDEIEDTDEMEVEDVDDEEEEEPVTVPDSSDDNDMVSIVSSKSLPI